MVSIHASPVRGRRRAAAGVVHLGRRFQSTLPPYEGSDPPYPFDQALCTPFQSTLPPYEGSDGERAAARRCLWFQSTLPPYEGSDRRFASTADHRASFNPRFP